MHINNPKTNGRGLRMKTFANAFHKFSDVINKICTALIVALLSAMVIVTILQIYNRLAGHSLLWSEEACRFMLVWSTFIGASVAYKSGAHISVTLVQNMLPAPAEKALRILVHAVCIVVFCAVVYFGYKYAGKQMQLAPTLHFRMKWMYYSVPVGFGLMLIHAVDAILEILQEKGRTRL